MSKKTNELSKSSKKINFDDFFKLCKLLKRQIWLEDVYEALIELWNLCEYKDEQNLIYKLLRRFIFLDSKMVSKKCKDISKIICDEWRLKSQSTIIIALCNDKKPDGSQYFIQILKNKFADRYDWTEAEEMEIKK